ncbi:MAG TPA: hypothetical protein VK608_03470, partial [Edaphobacter sp.]|nr:hypothetical protein [Edaphobacter sp.]
IGRYRAGLAGDSSLIAEVPDEEKSLAVTLSSPWRTYAKNLIESQPKIAGSFFLPLQPSRERPP